MHYRTRWELELEKVVRDECETDSQVRTLAKRVLPAVAVDGDSYGVPGVADVVELLVAEIERLRQ